MSQSVWNEIKIAKIILLICSGQTAKHVITVSKQISHCDLVRTTLDKETLLNFIKHIQLYLHCSNYIWQFSLCSWTSLRLSKSPVESPEARTALPSSPSAWRGRREESRRRIKKNRALIGDNNMALDSFRRVVSKRRRRRRCAANGSETSQLEEWLAESALYSTLCLKCASGGAEKNQLGCHQISW